MKILLMIEIELLKMLHFNNKSKTQLNRIASIKLNVIGYFLT